MEITTITPKDKLWNKLVNYTNSCDWEAWPILAQKMEENNFLDWEKIFVATEDNNIVGYCTFTKDDWIPNCEYSPFIGFIFVDKNYRWKRVSEKMINTVEEYAKTLNFDKLYIVSDHKWLYENIDLKNAMKKLMSFDVSKVFLLEILNRFIYFSYSDDQHYK